jgi:hypothetical protein
MGILDIIKKYAGKYLPKLLEKGGEFLGKKLKEKGYDFLSNTLKDISKSRNLDDLKERGKHIATEQAGHIIGPMRDKVMERVNPFLRG